MVLPTIIIAAAAACYCELLHELGEEVSGPGGVSQASFVAILAYSCSGATFSCIMLAWPLSEMVA
jgi:hypothetical protein